MPLLATGLAIGCTAASVIFLLGWILLAREPEAATPPNAPAPPSSTPLPTIPVATIPAPPFSGGTVSTTTGAIQFTLPTGSTIFVGPDSEVE